jgi:uncharacterized repeat protein (TIGR03803 family)
VIWNFRATGDGGKPVGTLVIDPAGNLYGTTLVGGNGTCSSGCGTVFELLPPTGGTGAWHERILYNFLGSKSGDGQAPFGSLFRNASGVLVGTTGDGGTGTACSEGCGTVYELIPGATAESPWTETVLHSFAGGTTDGAGPIAGVTYFRGAYYGTTTTGGAGTACSNGCGTVFRLLPPILAQGSWRESVVHSFADAATDGSLLYGGIVGDASGSLYGTASGGGSGSCMEGCGIVFELKPNGADGMGSLLVDFRNQRRGDEPAAALAIDASGKLYGTTIGGGAANTGIVYKIEP